MKSNRLYFLPIEAEGGLYTGRQFSYGISYNGGSNQLDDWPKINILIVFFEL